MRSWYRSTRWRKLRDIVLKRDGHICEHCGGWGDEVDHIIPRHKNLDLFWELSNLQTICRGCHIEKTRREQAKHALPIKEQREWDTLLAGRLV